MFIIKTVCWRKIFLISCTHVGVSLPERLSRQQYTLRALLTHYWDIQSVPRRSFFEILSWFATNELEREKLVEFTTPEGQEELYSYCNRPRRNIIEVSEITIEFSHTWSYLVLYYTCKVMHFNVCVLWIFWIKDTLGPLSLFLCRERLSLFNSLKLLGG